MSINNLIARTARCLKCGAQGIGTCACWVQCSCGWTAEAGKPCRNPATTDCSTKLKYGKRKRRSRAA